MLYRLQKVFLGLAAIVAVSIGVSFFSYSAVNAADCTYSNNNKSITCGSGTYTQDSAKTDTYYGKETEQCKGGDRSRIVVSGTSSGKLYESKDGVQQQMYGSRPVCKKSESPVTVSISGKKNETSDASDAGAIKGFGTSLDGLKKSHNDKCSKMPNSYEASECRNSFNAAVKDCTNTARSHAASIRRETERSGDVTVSDEDNEKNAKTKFVECFSKKTGTDVRKVNDALASVNMTDVFKSSTDARNDAQKAIDDAKDKEECEAADGEWDDEAKTCSDPNAGTCTIDGVGWLVCPVIDFMASIADKAYELLADSFLQIPASAFDTSGPAFKAWQTFQSIANVILVIMFLVIIFSQLTSMGVSSYGIKKLLPKIIVVAVLMNLSFLICSIAVDLSNILGVGLKDLFEAISSSGATPQSLEEKYAPGSTGNPWVGIVGGAAIGGVGVMAAGGVSLALVALIPVLFAAVIALIMIFFILVGRQVLIILLTVIAPIAFAMYLLPNTQGWFDKWRKTFMTLLMVFPVIGLVYGASELASTVLQEVYKNETGAVSGLGEIIAAGILVIPFFVVPSLLKKSLNAIGGIGNTLGNLNAKMSGGLKNKLSNSGYNKNLEEQSAMRRAERNAGIGNGVRARVNRRINSSPMADRLSSGWTSKRRNSAAILADATDEKMQKDFASQINYGNFTGDQMWKGIENGGMIEGQNGVSLDASDPSVRRALITAHQKYATTDQNRSLAGMMSGMSQAERKTADAALAGDPEKNTWYKGAVRGEAMAGNLNVDSAISGSIMSTTTSAYATSTPDNISNVASSASTDEERAAVARMSDAALSDSKIRAELTQDQVKAHSHAIRDNMSVEAAHSAALKENKTKK